MKEQQPQKVYSKKKKAIVSRLVVVLVIKYIPYRSAPYGSCTKIPYSSSARYLQKHIAALVLCVASLALCSLSAQLVTNLPSPQPVSSFSVYRPYTHVYTSLDAHQLARYPT